MINSAALLPSLSRSSGLSPRSAIGLNIIRRDSIAVDRLLKERLVLSKVRYGIERQEQERERRRNREADLEADSKQNYEVGDAPNNPRKRRRGIGGLLGTVFGGILSSLGGVAFQTAPAFLLARKNVIKGGTNFNRTIGATGGLLNTIKGQKGPFDTLRKVKLDPVKNIGKTITKFGNSLTLFVNSAIAGQIGGRALNKLRTPAQVKAQVAQSAKARQKITSKIVATERVREVANENARQKRVIGKKQVVLNKFKFTEQQKVIAGQAAKESTVTATVDPSQRDFASRNRLGDPIFDDITQELTPERRAFRYGKAFNQIEVRGEDIEFIGDEVFLNRKYSKTPKPVLRLEEVNLGGRNFYFMSEADSARLIEDRITRSLQRKSNVRFAKDFQRIPSDQFKSIRMGPNIEQYGPFEARQINTPEARAKRFQQTFGKPTGANPFTGQGTFQTTPTITSFDPETGVTTQTLTKGREFDPITGAIKAKKRSVKASKVVPKKGIGKFLSNIGGSQFLKPMKEFVGKGVKNIPFIGDLIGILLDVFVFGEPIQRALFLAGGSALGGFLGGLAGAIGGPPGVLIGGIIGGIAGDLLGGAFYDLLFRRGQKGSAGQRFGASATKASIKAGLFTGGFAGYGTYMLGEGGREFVLDADSTAALERRSPGFLMALNKARGAEAIGVIEDYASYDKTSTGRERMMPIPIPIPQKDSSVQEIMMTDSEAGGGTGGGFLTFLSEHYRRG